MIDEKTIWLGAGLRTPFVGVDGPFAHRDSLALSVPVVQAMAPLANSKIDFAVWGCGGQSCLRKPCTRSMVRGKARPARADLYDNHAMQHQHRRGLRSRRYVGQWHPVAGTCWRCGKYDPRADRARTGFSDWLRRVVQARGLSQRLS